jgi:peptidyl-prolyl cis-trans isomerase C
MSNRNTFVLVIVIAVATLVISFAILKRGGDAAPPVSPAAQDAQKKDATDSAKAPDAAPNGDDPVVARVNGKPILRSEVLGFIRNFPPQMQQLPPEQLFPLAAEQLSIAKVIDQKAATDTTLDDDAEVLKMQAEAKMQILRTAYLQKAVDKQVDEARLRKAYDAMKAEQGEVPEARARHILVEKEETAKDIIAKLGSGEKFEDLAKQYSTDPSNKESGGDLGYFSKDAMVKEFADAAFALNKDEVSKTPVKTQFGYHVIQLLDKRTRPVPSFEEVKPQIQAGEQRKVANEILEKWRKDADIEIFDLNGKKLDKLPSEAAQETGK